MYVLKKRTAFVLSYLSNYKVIKMSKMFSVTFKTTKEIYAEINELMSKNRFVKPVTKREIDENVTVNYYVYKTDSFYLTRQLQKRSIWYELQGEM